MRSGQTSSTPTRATSNLAGDTAGRRRGSILVIVVGTLALLAVLMLVYVSVGRQDARTKAAASTRERLDDVPQQFADYLANQIIAADAVATYYDNRDNLSTRPEAPADEPVLMREAFDYGSTDWTRSSVTLERTTAFNPVGTYVRLRDPNLGPPSRGNPDPAYTGVLAQRMEPSDPWLASNEPTWLGFVRWSGNGPRGNDLASPELAPYALEQAGAKKDWLHISNVAPDGKFVNLYNLAPKVGEDRRVGNLKAMPGFGTFDGDLGPLPRMSQNLSLLSSADNHSDADQVGDLASVTAWGDQLSAADRLRPAFWDSWQRGAFRHATENRASIHGGDPQYLPYQWADADGDGMFDSRWMQLTDSRGFDATSDLDGIVNLLESDGKYRYFFATRIIDASGMINVNTATDLAAAPTATNPVGLTPADIDLRRLLTLHDVYDGYRFAPGEYRESGLFGRGAGYDGIINEPSSPAAGAPAPGIATGDYRPVGQPTIPPPGPSAPASVREGYNAIRAYSAGSMAYTALRLSLAAGLALPLESITGTGTEREYRGMALFTQFSLAAFPNRDTIVPENDPGRVELRDPLARRLWDFVPGPEGADPNTADRSLKIFPTARLLDDREFATNKFNVHSPLPFIPLLDQGEGFYPSLARRRADHYARQSRSSQGGEAELVLLPGGRTISQFRSTSSFGIDDLSELLTYRASNDIGVLSTLELVLGGRDRAPFDVPAVEVPADAPDPRRFDPLRSNRGPELELARDVYRREGDREQVIGSDGLADGRARLQLDADIRQRLTTVSGARSLYTGMNRDGGGVGYDALDSTEVKTNASSLLATYVDDPSTPLGHAAVNALFGTYANALLPFSNLPATWQRSRDVESRQFNQFKTLSYGHDGAAPALMAAAHMAANLADMADADQVASTWTLILDNNARAALDAAQTEFLAWRAGRRLDLEQAVTEANSPDRLPAGATVDARVAPALNIRGIEPQPFVTAVATFTIYTDKDPPVEENVKFRTDLTENNPEFLYRVLAFRLHNPFGVDITLGDMAGAIVETSIADPARREATKRLMRDVDLADPAMYELDRQRDFYYIKFGGRTFLLTGIEERVRYGNADQARLNRGTYLPGGGLASNLDVSAATEYDPETRERRGSPLTIKAGGTIVAYALSQMPRKIAEDRLRVPRDPRMPALPRQSRDDIRQLIERQLRLNWASDTQCVWIPEIDVDGAAPTGKLGVLDQNDRLGNTPAFKAWTQDPTEVGQLMQPNSKGDPIYFDLGGSDQERLLDNTEVQLWRAVRSAGIDESTSDDRIEQTPRPLPTLLWDGAAPVAGEQPFPSASVYVRNRPENDQLMDRLRVPLRRGGNDLARPAYVDLDARLIPENPSDRQPQAEVADSDNDEYLRGLTLAVWAAVRRPQDPALDGAGGVIPSGALGAFCLEAKPSDLTRSPEEWDWRRQQWNRYSRQDLNWERPDSSDWEGGVPDHGPAAEKTLAEWVRRWKDDSNPGVNVNQVACRAIATSGLERLPGLRYSEKNGNELGLDYDLSSPMPDAVEGSYGILHAQALAGNTPAARAERLIAGSNPERFDPIETERFTSTFRVRDGRSGGSADATRSTLRVADLLLPMGIGPVEAPLTIGGQPNTDLNLRWTTLGEALVASMWEWGDDRAVPSNDPSTLLRPVQAPGGVRPKFDRGQLRLDDFAPFYNTNGDAAGLFEPALNDVRYFTQVPLALNVLDMFSAGVAGQESLTQAVPGLININAAPLAVARCLPMLSPLSRAGASEVQTIAVSRRLETPPPDLQPPSESNPLTWPPPFTLTVTRGPAAETTGAIPVGASPAVVQAALESLSIVGRGNVSVTAGAPKDDGTGWGANPSLAPYRRVDYVVTFTGALAMLDLPLMQLAFVNYTPTSDPPDVPPLVQQAVAGSNVRLGPGWWGEGSGIDQTVDLAATLVANRDKIEVPLRPQSWQLYSPAAGGGGVLVQSVRYPHVDVQGRLATPATPPQQVMSRAMETGIDALSETPGFQSLGALMTLRYRGENLEISSGQPYDNAGSMRTSIDYMGYPVDPLSIPFTGFQADNQSMIGVDSVLGGSSLPTSRSDFPDPEDPDFRPDTLQPGDFVGTDNMPNEYKEKLAIANAVVNTASTRSDYFIAWFLVHGYQQSDVENLGLTDVLTPSIARRFVMVVDRSNVVKRGDKPRVLLFKEVPVAGR